MSAHEPPAVQQGRSSARSLWPWWAAAAVYGPYRPPEPDLGTFTPLLERLLPARALLSLGVAALVVDVIVSGVGESAQSAYAAGLVTMVVGPYGILLAVPVMVLVASRRKEAMLALARPFAVAFLTMVLSVLVFGVQLPGVRHVIEDVLGDGGAVVTNLVAVPEGLRLVLLPWLLVFGLCALYLIHRNTFGVDRHTLLAPIVAIWLAWTVGAVDLSMAMGDGKPRSVVIAAVVGAVIATAVSVWEIVELRRSGVTFRNGPWREETAPAQRGAPRAQPPYPA